MRTLLGLCLMAGCLGDAAVGTPDLSAAVMDLSPSGDFATDGGLYNCAQLNTCEQACKDAACITACRMKATASAITKEMALQACFNQYCPQNTDGSGGVCMDPSSNDCKQCILNTQVSPTNSCAGNPPECHQCYTQAAACVSDA